MKTSCLMTSAVNELSVITTGEHVLHFMLTIKKRPIVLAFFCAWILASCAEPKKDLAVFSGSTMGTTYNVKVVLESGQAIDSPAIVKALEAELQAINDSMSTYISDSELSRFNQIEVGTVFSVSERLCYLFDLSKQIGDLSGGSFDVTVGPLVNLWGFGPDLVSSSPSDEALQNALEQVGDEALSVDCEANIVSKSKALYVDLSAIAKGYATSELARLLSAKGFKHHMVEIGGELTLSGLNGEDQPWRIAVEKPQVGRVAQQLLALSGVSVATSGDYRNFVEVDGKKLSHTINPETGRPIFHSLASVTVVAENGELADGWATALNVMGLEHGFKLAEFLGIAAYFIARKNNGFEVKYTDAFKPYMVVQ